MEHSCEAYWTKAEGLARDAICTMGVGAKRLTDAAKRQLEIADLRAGVNVGLRELGELLYATHTGTPTDSDRLLEKTNTISEREKQDQLLDAMDLEREKGITIKSHPVTIFYKAGDGKTYKLNLLWISPMKCPVPWRHAREPSLLWTQPREWKPRHLPTCTWPWI